MKVRLDLGECHNIAKGGLLDILCFIKSPKCKSFLKWSVTIDFGARQFRQKVGVSLADCGVGFGY